MEMNMIIFFTLKKKNVSETPDAIHSVNREMIFTDKSTFWTLGVSLWFDTTSMS